jgi:hypothetical protein
VSLLQALDRGRGVAHLVFFCVRLLVAAAFASVAAAGLRCAFNFAAGFAAGLARGACVRPPAAAGSRSTLCASDAAFPDTAFSGLAALMELDSVR